MTDTAELTTPNRTRTFPGDASAAAFPLGGIGTGNVSLGARGELRDWEIFNGPDKGRTLPYTFFALRAATEGADPVTKVLESRLRPPYESWTGLGPESLAGVPRFAESRLRGEYPFAWVELLDDELPLEVTLEAFTPLVPLDAEASALPAAVLRYRVRNVGSAPVEVTVAGSVFNPIGHGGHVDLIPRIAGDPSTEYRDDGGISGLAFSTSLAADDLAHGSLALVARGGELSAKPWSPTSPDGVSDLWDDLHDDGRLDPGFDASPVLGHVHDDPDEPAMSIHWPEQLAAMRKQHTGALAVTATVAPDEEHAFEFVLAWHFPNRPRAWVPGGLLEPTNADQVVRNHYATLHADAWAVARHLVENLAELEARTRLFHESLWGSTLPAEVLDAIGSNITVLRSTTCFRLEDGTFAGWEGCRDDAGSCEGSCTHVWNYAHTAAFLFPELERSMRRVEFGLETDEHGVMQFRSNRIFGGKPWGYLPAVDGQLGSVIRMYREWRFSGDDDFLRELWPGVARAVDYAFTGWDTDGDLVLDGRQHNTYDIDFYGPNPLSGAMFCAALVAASRLAERVGDDERASRYRDAAQRSAARLDELLWNGEYYIQLLDDVDEHPQQHGTGCLSDQLLGQLNAHVAGLGYVLPEEHVRQAVGAIHRHNFRARLRDQRNFLRTYALEDEGGLLLCTWPHGGRPRRPFFYSDEVWTGIEHQVAAHLIYEGLVDEGLELVRAVRARHDGYRRSPWNEAECGNHYARSLSSWALLLALSGVRYDGVEKSISFAPAVDGPVRCFFSTGSGWGVYERDEDGERLQLLHGTLALEQPERVTLGAGDVLRLS
jgi:uncharacterized protein (DUF608 family)